MPQLSPNQTLRHGLVDAINELRKLLFQTQDEQEETQIRKLRNVYFELLEAVIRQEIDRRTQEFTLAVVQLEAARKNAVKAKKDIGMIAEAITSAADAAKTVSRIVNVGREVLA